MTAVRVGRLVAGLVVAVLAVPKPALAQSAAVEIGVGGVFNGAVPAGTVNATLLDPSGGSLTLFRTTNRIAPGRGVEGLISARLKERLRVELAVGWGTAEFESRISGDFEGVPELEVTQKVNQFTAELALAWRVVHSGRFDVFVRGAGGGFREITSDRALVDNGWRASVGGGAQIRLRQAPSGWLGGLAVRADIRMLARGGGIAFGDSGTRVSPSVFAGLVIGH